MPSRGMLSTHILSTESTSPQNPGLNGNVRMWPRFRSISLDQPTLPPKERAFHVVLLCRARR